MTIEELYIKLGGDYKKVCSRLPGRRFIEHFLERYLSDDSAEALLVALKTGDARESYRLALALKGVAGNLGFEDLEKTVARLAALLREGTVTPDAIRPAETIEGQHQAAVKAIRLYLADR